MSDSLPRGVYLNIGSGPVAPEGWLNLDASWNLLAARVRGLRPALKSLRLISPEAAAQEWSPHIRFHDITKGLPLADGAAAVVYSSHVIEHLTRSQAKAFVHEAHRVLASGGVIRIIVPDLETLATRYLQSKKTWSEGDTPIPAEQFLKLLNTCADYGQVNPVLRLYRAYNDVHTHKWMYDAHSLKQLLREAGFPSPAQKGFLDSIIPAIQDVEKEPRFEHGICLEARK